MEVFKGLTVRPSPDIHREKTQMLLPLVNEGGVKFSMPKIDYSALPSVKVRSCQSHIDCSNRLVAFVQEKHSSKHTLH